MYQCQRGELASYSYAIVTGLKVNRWDSKSSKTATAWWISKSPIGYKNNFSRLNKVMHAQIVVLPVIWNVITVMWRHCNVSYVFSHAVRVKCFFTCLNFSFAGVPAMTSKQKMNQYPKSSEIDIAIMSYWRQIYYHFSDQNVCCIANPLLMLIHTYPCTFL